ncbi:unnamed protein product, partial [Effrenium voratum]
AREHASSDDENEDPDADQALRKVLFDVGPEADRAGPVSPTRRRRSRQASLGGHGTVCVPIKAGLTEQQVQGLREVFGLFDPEASGEVQPGDIRRAAEAAGLQEEAPEVWRLLAGLECRDSVDFEDGQRPMADSEPPRLPVVLGRTGADEIRRERTEKAKKPDIEAGEADESNIPVERQATNRRAQKGVVSIALNMTRGGILKWSSSRLEEKGNFYVQGGRHNVESLNENWLDKELLDKLLKDINRLGDNLHLFEREPYVLCENEKYCGVGCFVVTLCLIAATTVCALMQHEQVASLMIASGVMVSMTTMCCFCLNFKRKRIVDWEVPHDQLHRFAAKWTKKHGALLRFHFMEKGPSFFILTPPEAGTSGAA